MNKSKEKAQATEDTTAQAHSVNTKQEYDNLEAEVCPLPKTPDNGPFANCPKVEGNGLVSLWFGEHKPGGIEATLFIDTGNVDNATNRLLACLCFFRWSGKEFTPVPLIEGRESLRYIVLGNIEEAHIEVNPNEGEVND